MLCRQNGATAAYTPMLHARIFSEDAKYRAEHFTTCEGDRCSPVAACTANTDQSRLLRAFAFPRTLPVCCVLQASAPVLTAPCTPSLELCCNMRERQSARLQAIVCAVLRQ